MIGAVVFVLLIACANVANLLIARAAAREKELAIRAALGAGRWRLIRQLLLESLSLATLGGLAGFLLARRGVELFLKQAPKDLIPGEAVIGVDMQTLGFTLLLTLLTTLICSPLPALRFSKGAVLDGLKEGARLSTSASGNQRMRSALVTLEVALSVILLIGAGRASERCAQTRRQTGDDFDVDWRSDWSNRRAWFDAMDQEIVIRRERN